MNCKFCHVNLCKINILQNGTTNKYERSHFKPNCATYKCMSVAPHTYNAVKISIKTAVFYNKICNVISINHTFWQYWNSLSVTRCIRLLSYNDFPNKILFFKTLICELKYLKFPGSCILSTRTQYGASVQLYHNALILLNICYAGWLSTSY